MESCNPCIWPGPEAKAVPLGGVRLRVPPDEAVYQHVPAPARLQLPDLLREGSAERQNQAEGLPTARYQPDQHSAARHQNKGPGQVTADGRSHSGSCPQYVFLLQNFALVIILRV